MIYHETVGCGSILISKPASMTGGTLHDFAPRGGAVAALTLIVILR